MHSTFLTNSPFLNKSNPELIFVLKMTKYSVEVDYAGGVFITILVMVCLITPILCCLQDLSRIAMDIDGRLEKLEKKLKEQPPVAEAHVEIPNPK